MRVQSLFLQLCQDIPQLALYACIHPVRVIFENESPNNFGINLCLKLHSTLSSALHHLLHFLLGIGRNGSSGDEFSAGDVLLFPVKRDIRSRHELNVFLSVSFEHETDESVG